MYINVFLIGWCYIVLLRYVTAIIIPAKAFARDYGITGVRLSVCLFITTITK